MTATCDYSKQLTHRLSREIFPVVVIVVVAAVTDWWKVCYVSESASFISSWWVSPSFSATVAAHLTARCMLLYWHAAWPTSMILPIQTGTATAAIINLHLYSSTCDCYRISTLTSIVYCYSATEWISQTTTLLRRRSQFGPHRWLIRSVNNQLFPSHR